MNTQDQQRLRRLRRCIKLSAVEVNHLLNLVIDNEREGSYYGNREQYAKRSRRLRAMLEDAVPAEAKTLSVGVLMQEPPKS